MQINEIFVNLSAFVELFSTKSYFFIVRQGFEV